MQHIKGYLLILASVLSFAVMSALVKMIPQVDSTLTTFTRFAVGVGILGILAMTQKDKAQLCKQPAFAGQGVYGRFGRVYALLFDCKVGCWQGNCFRVFLSCFCHFVQCCFF